MARFVVNPFTWPLLVPAECVQSFNFVPHHPQEPLLLHTVFCVPLHVLNFLRDSVVNLYNYSFSSHSHAWTVAPVTFTWQCVFNDTAYHVNHILIFPEATVQLTLVDDTAVHFPYRSAQWTEFALYLYHRTTPPPPPTTNRLDQLRYFIIRDHLIHLYKAPRNFLRAAATQADRVSPVSAPPR